MKSVDALSWSAEDTYCSEEYFQRMLIFERKKSQRTGKPFILILLDISKLVKGRLAEKTFVLRRLISVLNSSTRDIDVKGWYMFGSIIGIICQDFQGQHRAKVTGRIKDKLLEEGVSHLVVNTVDAIKLLCLLYPDS